MNNMPTITKNLLIINVLVFAGQYVALQYGINLEEILGLHFFLASDFKLFQFFTYMFMHGGWEHLFFNMFAVWMFGRLMENVMGSRRFLFYYIMCGLGAGFMQEIVQYVHYMMLDHATAALAYGEMIEGNFVIVDGRAMDLNSWVTVGASGAVYGILLSFGMTFPNERLFIFPLPVPIKAKYLVMGYVVIELLSGIGRSSDGVAHFAHLGGMLVGFIILMYWRGGRNNFTHTTSSWELWFKNIKKKFGQKNKSRFTVNEGGCYNSDMEFRRRENARQAEIDAILDKVKKGGYNSLADEEKQKLFEASGRK